MAYLKKIYWKSLDESIEKDDKKKFIGMEKLYKQAQHDKVKVKQRGTVYPMLANAELQTENKAFEIIPRS